MPRYEIEANGKRFEVEAPNPQAAAEAVQGMQQQAPQQPAAPAQPATPPQGGSFLDPLMQGVTLGAADEIKGAVRGGARYLFGDSGKGFGDLYGEEVGKARKNLEAYRERNPWTSAASEIGGAGLGVIATRGASLVPKAASTLGKIGVGALEGTGLAGLYGFNAGEGGAAERGMSAAKSAPFGAVAGAAGGAIGAAMGRGARTAAPALDDLRATANAAFQQVDNAGATLRPQSSTRIANDIAAIASKQKINPKLHPKAYAALEEAMTMRGQTPTLSELHQMRQIFQDAASSIDPADRRMASLFINALDDQIDKLNVFDMVGGDPRASVAALREGMGAWKKLRKGEMIAKIFSDAEIDAGAKYTQAGMETAIRNGFKKLAKNPKALRGFSKEEIEAIRKVAMGGPLENVTRWAGKFAPRGVVSALPTLFTASYDLGTGAGLAIGGEMASRAATAMTMRNARLADEMIRGGGKAAQKALTPAQKNALALTMGTGLPVWPMIDRQVSK